MPGRADGSIERLEAGGPVLGIFPDAAYEGGTVTLEPGDLLFLYSDGVTEAMDADDVEFGEVGVLERLARGARLPLPALLDDVVAAVREHARGVARGDDLTALAVARDEAA